MRESTGIDASSGRAPIRASRSARDPRTAWWARTTSCRSILGPVFEDHEADFGRTYVVGADPEKCRLRDDLELLFRSCRDLYLRSPDMTGAELYASVVAACAARGWGFGGVHAGHLIGPFAMAREERDAARNRIRPDNDVPMNALGKGGTHRNWILEIHLLDPTGTFGGFFEDRLTT